MDQNEEPGVVRVIVPPSGYPFGRGRRDGRARRAGGLQARGSRKRVHARTGKKRKEMNFGARESGRNRGEPRQEGQYVRDSGANSPRGENDSGY